MQPVDTFLAATTGALVLWNCQTGATVFTTAPYTSLTPTSVSAAASLINAATDSAAGTFDGSTSVLTSDTATGNALAALVNSGGLTLNFTIKANAAALLSGKTLATLQAAGTGVEIKFGTSAFFGSTTEPNVGVNVNGRVVMFWAYGDNSTFGHITDGNEHELTVSFQHIAGGTAVRVKVDGQELTANDNWTSSAIPTSGVTLKIGNSFAGVIQCVSAHSGFGFQSDVTSMIVRKWTTTSGIATAGRMTVGGMSWYTDTGKIVPASVGDQVHSGKSADGTVQALSDRYYRVIDLITHGATTTVRTTASHGLVVGQRVRITATDSTPPIDGYVRVATVPTATTFTIPKTTSADGFAGNMIVEHGPRLARNPRGTLYLDFGANIQQRRDWPDSGGNTQAWLDVWFEKASAPGVKLPISAGWAGVYVVASTHVNHLHFTAQALAQITDGSGTNYATLFAVGASIARATVSSSTTERTPTNAALKICCGSPGVSTIALAIGTPTSGISAGNNGSAATSRLVVDGVASDLSWYFPIGSVQYGSGDRIRIGVRDTSSLGSNNTVCDGFAGNLFELQVSRNRAPADSEIAAAAAASRAEFGFAASFVGYFGLLSDSTGAGEQDTFALGDDGRGGMVPRCDELLDFFVANLSIPGIRTDNFISGGYTDLSSAFYVRDLPTILVEALGINDQGSGVSDATRRTQTQTIVSSITGNITASKYLIRAKTPLGSPDVYSGLGDPTFEALLAGTPITPPFNAFYQRPGSGPATVPPTTYDTGKHPNPAGMANEATALRAAIRSAAAALGIPLGGGGGAFIGLGFNVGV